MNTKEKYITKISHAQILFVEPTLAIIAYPIYLLSARLSARIATVIIQGRTLFNF